VRSSYKSTSKDLSLEKMRGEGGGRLSRTLATVEEGEGTTMIPQRQPPPIKIPKFKGENDPNLYIE